MIKAVSLLELSVRHLVYWIPRFIQTFLLYVGMVCLVMGVTLVAIPSSRDQLSRVRDLVSASFDPPAPAATSTMPVSEAPPLPFDDQNGFFNVLAKYPVQAASLNLPGITQEQALALRAAIVNRYHISPLVLNSLLQIVYQQADYFKLDPLLILGVISVESAFNPFSQSGVGAQGLMQVYTRVHTDKFGNFFYGKHSALDPFINIQVGSQILRDCIKRRHSVNAGLSCYNGLSTRTSRYADRVQEERKRLALLSGIPLGLNLDKYK